MSRSVGGSSVPPPPPPTTTSSTSDSSQSRYQNIAECSRTSSQVPHGFKELVEKRCEERGILWLPIPNRFREAKQVYRCGSVQVYVDRNVLFACDNNGIWNPVSLQQLLDRAVK